MALDSNAEERSSDGAAPSQDAPKPSSGGFPWKGGCILLAVVSALCAFAIVLAIAIAAVVAISSSSMPSLDGLSAAKRIGGRNFTEQHISGSSFAKDKIAVVDIVGVITSSSSGSSMYESASSGSIIDQLQIAEDDPSVKAIVINLDTPGGEVTASDEIYHEIMLAREKSRKPVVAMMNSLAASGGYYVSVACDRIVANRLTLTGSIGVIMEGYNYAALLDKVGVKAEVYKSAPMKDMLNGARIRTPEEIAIAQKLIDNTYDEFVAVVSKGRNIPKDKIKGCLIGDGRVLDGRQALEAKLVDKLGYYEDAISEAASLAKISKYKVVQYNASLSFSEMLERLSAPPAKRSVRVDLGGISSEMPPLRKGCMYFLPSCF